jgi:nucleotide-binding universal stress UspA family protein
VLSVAEVIQPVAVSMERDSIDVVDVQVRTAAEAKAAASGAARHLQDRGFQSEGIAMEGNPETAIIEHARNWGADLIVVGSHDRSLLERLLMGNVSDRVVKHSPCSVLVVKPRVAA